MDGFLILRCLRNASIYFFEKKNSKFFSPPKRPPKVYLGSKHVSWKWLYCLRFSTQMKFFTSYGFYGPGATTFEHEIGRVPITFQVKFKFLNDLIFAIGTRGENRHSLDANYSIKHNNKVLIQDILEVDLCLRIQNLKCFFFFKFVEK